MKRLWIRGSLVALFMLAAPVALADVAPIPSPTPVPSDSSPSCDVGCVTSQSDISHFGLAGAFVGLSLAGGYILRRRS